jgi:hypothetical protein
MTFNFPQNQGRYLPAVLILHQMVGRVGPSRAAFDIGSNGKMRNSAREGPTRPTDIAKMSPPRTLTRCG